MAVIVTTMVLQDSDGAFLEDQCSLCFDLTPWVMDVRCYDTLIHICLDCAANITTAANSLRRQRTDSQA